MKLHIPAFEKARVLVIGDVMLDRYWYGNTSRISPEAPVPVVHVKETEERPGGAGNVALNLKALGCDITLLSMVGQDTNAENLEHKLQAAGINVFLQRESKLPTLVKLRVLSLHQQLIRLDFEEGFHATDKNKMLACFKEHLPNFDVIILSDYGKGVLSESNTLISLAKAAGKSVLVDPKSTNFNIYRGATVLTPNRKEFEAVVGPCHNESELVTKGQQLLKDYDLEALLITRGEQGMTLLRQDQEELHFPARAREVYDVTGAGDTVISLIAATLATGEDLPIAAALANVAAGIAVSKLGAATVSVPELRRAISQEQSSDKGIMSEDQLAIAIADARAHGERIVMTNGCFDILHAGHVAYLEQAKALGDRLIVAVNDDGSVSRLKGPDRPINTLARRMAVLAGLGAVDWVVPFSEDTPERLITHLLPDVLVKGGDYKVEDIAGAKAVLANGGGVEILQFVEGCSTTAMVEHIRKEKIKNVGEIA